MTKEELGKEAEEYADDKKHFDGQAQLYIIDGYLAGAEPREKRIGELERENTELQKGLSVLNASNSFNKEQLTKSKEIIKELLDTQSQLDPYRDIFKDRILKAEQFIKEIEG